MGIWSGVQPGEISELKAEPISIRTSPDPGPITQEAFSRRLHLEQRRTERSRRPFILLLMEGGEGIESSVWQRVQSVVAGAVRETDIQGWYQQDSVLGVIFTEVGTETEPIRKVLQEKLTTALLTRLTNEQARKITFSFCAFPDDWNKPKSGRSTPSTLYPEACGICRNPALIAKRGLDILGSLAAVVVAAPLFVAIAAAVKITSRGPILFRQVRVGQYGQTFTFLKFRSMYTGNDQRVHEEYVKSLIAGTAASTDVAGTGKAVFKLTNDPRITPVGKWLRKTSMDELPQFLNVLTGEMALVGPRPPIPYEVEAYDIWHRRRLLSVKPGITGLWQVTGRSKTTFEDMVRLDLQYAKSWSLWLDLKILLQTPAAIVTGDGAR